MYRFIFFLVGILFLVACSNVTGFANATTHLSSQSSLASVSSAFSTPVDTGQIAPQYAEFDIGARTIGNGQFSLLFFCDTGDLICQSDDAFLRALYKSNKNVTISTYFVHLSSTNVNEIDLKEQYQVTQQPAFILIDGAGKKVAQEIRSTESELQTFVLDWNAF